MQITGTTILAALALLLLATTANAQYVGVTSGTFDGAQGIIIFNHACHADHPGSRMCTSEEFIETLNSPIAGSSGERAWIRPEFKPVAYGGTSSRATVVDASGIGTDSGGFTCQAWADPSYYGLTVELAVGSFQLRSCEEVRKVACCIPVPEPSASLSIPSGAAMVLALAKLRGVGLGR
jgi:hypothetical protein